MVDVLIIGAGPVGLTAAIAISSLGKTVRIIDKNLDITTQIRAIGINPRSLILLEPFGLTNQLISNGIKVSKLNLLNNTRVLVELSFDCIDSPYNFMLSLPQKKIEKLFISALTKRGIAVERDTELTSFKQNENGVVATINKQGKTEDVTCSFLYGADGAHSTVRHQAGIPFEGNNILNRWGIIDVEMDWPFPQSNIFMFDHALLIVLPISRDRYFAVSNIENTFSLLPKESKVHNVHRQANFNVAFRLAKDYQSGRVYLGGDAAHIFPPIGGRGMNLGIEDAVIFTQLLATGQLNEYSHLQRRNATQVLHDSDILVKVATLSTPLAKFARNHILVPVVRNSFIQKRFCWRMTGLGNSLTASLLTSMTRLFLG